jgi:hypothetical protein
VSDGVGLLMPARLDCQIERRLRELARTFDLTDQQTLFGLGQVDPELRRLLGLRLMAEPLLLLTMERTAGRA